MGKEIKLILFCICITCSFYCQNSISGKITDKNKNAILGVSVVLENKQTNNIDDHTFSLEDGSFFFDNVATGVYIIRFLSMSFSEENIEIKVKKSPVIIKNIILEENIRQLEEVFIKTQKPILIKKDTIEVRVSNYLSENDETVEDLLKKIPGVTVNSEGTIKVNNKEIEKLMVDGDDLFEKGYKILSKNMPAYPVEEIQILKNYSNNRLLKDIEESNKVALNLKLDKNSKRIWFGNTEIGYGNNNFYSLKASLMNFGKKNKYVFLTNLNNIGYDATGDINHLIRPFRYGEPASIGDNQSANTLINLNAFTPNFKASRTNFNNAELASLNAIFTLSKKIKLKTIGFFNWDENDFFRNSVTTFTSSGTDFTNTEDFVLRKKKFTGFGKIDLNYDISKTKTLEVVTKFNNQDTNDNSNLLFNGTSTIENLQSNNTLFDQKITYTNKFKDTKAFLLTGRYINEKTPQNYNVNRFFYNDLFPNTTANNVWQQSENQMQFAGFEAHLLDRKNSGNLLELQFGNQYRYDRLNTTFSLFEDNTALETPNDFQNKTSYQTNDLYLETKYRYEINDFAITGQLGLHQLFNKLAFAGFSENQNPFFINPKLGLDWKINNKNKITSFYSYNTTNAKILDVYNDYVLTGFRSFSKGTGTFNQLDASTFSFNYQLGNWSDVFFANTSVVYNKNFDFFSTNSNIAQNQTLSEKIIIKDREVISVSSKIEYYFKKISSNLKLNIGYSNSNYKNIVNNSNLREITSNSYVYGLDISSGFMGFFNYYFGTIWSINKISVSSINNSFTNNVSFLDLTFTINEKFNFQIQTERYFFGAVESSDNTYYFADIGASYKPIKKKLTLSLSGKNLFNTETFRTFSISDISTSTTQYRLLERFVLLKAEYRF